MSLPSNWVVYLNAAALDGSALRHRYRAPAGMEPSEQKYKMYKAKYGLRHWEMFTPDSVPPLLRNNKFKWTTNISNKQAAELVWGERPATQE